MEFRPLLLLEFSDFGYQIKTHPPPIPAIALPKIIIQTLEAKPHINVPTPKATLEETNPALRPKISVSRPLKGVKAVCPIMKAVASHERSSNEPKSFDIGTARLAIIVESRWY